jgi:hypothetical protein
MADINISSCNTSRIPTCNTLRIPTCNTLRIPTCSPMIYVLGQFKGDFYKNLVACVAMYQLRVFINERIIDEIKRVRPKITERVLYRCRKILNYSFRDFILNAFINGSLSNDFILSDIPISMKRDYYEKIMHLLDMNQEHQDDLLSINFSSIIKYYNLTILENNVRITLSMKVEDHFEKADPSNISKHVKFFIAFQQRKICITLNYDIFKSLVYYRKSFYPELYGDIEEAQHEGDNDANAAMLTLDDDARNILVLLFRYYSIYRMGNVVSLQRSAIASLNVTFEFMSTLFDYSRAYCGMFHDIEKYYSPSIGNFNNFVSRSDDVILIIVNYYDPSISDFLISTVKKIIERRNSGDANRIIVVIPSAYRFLEYVFSRFLEFGGKYKSIAPSIASLHPTLSIPLSTRQYKYQLQTVMMSFIHRSIGMQYKTPTESHISIELAKKAPQDNSFGDNEFPQLTSVFQIIS